MPMPVDRLDAGGNLAERVPNDALDLVRECGGAADLREPGKDEAAAYQAEDGAQPCGQLWLFKPMNWREGRLWVIVQFALVSVPAPLWIRREGKRARRTRLSLSQTRRV